MIFGKRKVFDVLSLLAAVCALALMAAGVLAKRVGEIALRTDHFKASKTESVRFARLPKDLREASARGLPVRLWLGGVLVKEAASVDVLTSVEEPQYRVKAGTMIYVNELLYEKVASERVVLAADLPGKLSDWSKLAVALASLFVMFRILVPFRPPVAVSSGAERNGRLVALDSLRGIAAMIVVLMHAAGTFLPGHWLSDVEVTKAWTEVPGWANLVRNSPLAILLNGSLMVHLFWVMSGLVLAAPLLKNQSHQQIARSAVKRYFRLMPLAFVTTMASYFLHVASWYSVEEFNSVTRFGVPMLVFSGGSELSLVTAVRDAFFFGSSFNMPLWTINYEFLGSLFLFGVVACTLTLERRRLVWCVVFVVLMFVPGCLYLADFIAGLILADSLVVGTRAGACPLRRVHSVAIGVVAVALGAVSPAWVASLLGPVSELESVLTKFVPAVLFVFLALRSQGFEAMLKRGPLVWLGERSFALYVVHSLTVHLFGQWVAVACVRQGLGALTSTLLGFVAFIITTLLLSDWLTKWVDIPSTNFANIVGRWLAGVSPCEPAKVSVIEPIPARPETSEEVAMPRETA